MTDYFKRITDSYVQNHLPQSGRTRTIINTGGVDRGLGVPGVSLTDSHMHGPLKSLRDLVQVERTVENARIAVEIDPTVWSSLISMIMVANGSFEIVGTAEASEDAVQHIKDKCKLNWEKQGDGSFQPVGWNLDNLISEFLWKSMVDGKTFQRKYIPNQQAGIQSVDFLAYDENAYDFLELKDPITSNLLGYVQKAMVYQVPANWKELNFDDLSDPDGEEKTFHFDPDEVIHTKFLERDNKADSLVMRILDDVYDLKSIKNLGPTAARKAATVTAVEVGNEHGTIKPYNETDDYATKKAAVNREMQQIGEDFAKKEEKDTITHSYGIRPYMLGDGRIIDIPTLAGFYKQEIRAGLLTPDSRFESESSNKAVSQEQLGDMGQMPIIMYLRGFARATFEQSLFDHELSLQGYEDDIGKVQIKFNELKVDDELTLSQVADSAEKNFNIPSDVMVSTYYPRLDKTIQAYKIENPDFKLDKNPTQPVQFGNGIIDHNQHGSVINSVKQALIKQGYLEVIN